MAGRRRVPNPTWGIFGASSNSVNQIHKKGRDWNDTGHLGNVRSMSTLVSIPIPPRHISNRAGPSASGFTPTTDWFNAGALDHARAGVEMRSLAGNFEAIPGVQFANGVRSTPTTVNLGSTWISTEGEHDQQAWTDLTSNADASQQARLGFVTRNSSGSNVGSAELLGNFDLSFREYDEVYMRWATLVTNTTTATFFPGTAWFKAVDAPNARVLFELVAVNGDLSVEAAYQLANDRNRPDTPVVVGAARTSNGYTYPSAFATPAVSNRREIRFGWIVKLTAGHGLAWGRSCACVQLYT